MSVVSNSSPLINLARIGRLDFLPWLYSELVIPIRPLLDVLRDLAGFRVSETLYNRVLDDEGE